MKADFLAAHPVPDDSPLANDLPDSEALVVIGPHWEMCFDGALSSRVEVHQRDELLPNTTLATYPPLYPSKYIKPILYLDPRKPTIRPSVEPLLS